jgi:two-component system, cell cycle response regulator
MKILLADDDPISRRLMERMLQNSGYQVVTAENGRQALHELSLPGGPRLALLDWMMPELDGLEVCRAIRARIDQPYIYMLLLTSREAPDDIVSGLKSGADNYLTKPCRLAELLARLHSGRRILMLEDSLVEAREAMRFKATHDALTSLLDHGAILAEVQTALTQIHAHQSPASLLLCDIDHFKQVNDTYGHLVGDDILRQVSSRLTASTRSDDLVGRYGGEEFLIFLKSGDRDRTPRAHQHPEADTLSHRAEQIRAIVFRTPFATQAGPLSMSISIGVLAIDHHNATLPIESLLAAADNALYSAKAAGRNRVTFADTTQLPPRHTAGPLPIALQLT